MLYDNLMQNISYLGYNTTMDVHYCVIYMYYVFNMLNSEQHTVNKICSFIIIYLGLLFFFTKVFIQKNLHRLWITVYTIKFGQCNIVNVKLRWVKHVTNQSTIQLVNVDQSDLFNEKPYLRKTLTGTMSVARSSNSACVLPCQVL